FERRYGSTDSLPTLKDLIEFLEDHARFHETETSAPTHQVVRPAQRHASPLYSNNPRPQLPFRGPRPPCQFRPIQSQPRATYSAQHSAPAQQNVNWYCPWCNKKGHRLVTCKGYNNQPLLGRWDFISAKSRCRRCLGPHYENECKTTGSCKECGSANHHTSLHRPDCPSPVQSSAHLLPEVLRAKPSPTRPIDTHQPRSSHANRAHDSSPSCNNSAPIDLECTTQTTVLLPTVSLEIEDKYGHFHKARALLDCGSMITLITQNMAQILHLPIQRTTLKIAGVGGEHAHNSKACVRIKFRPTHARTPVITATAHILRNVTGCLPLTKVPSLHDDVNIPLADHAYNMPAPVDLLLGSDVLGYVLDGTRVSLGPGRPVAFGTIFDFALIGPVHDQSSAPVAQVNSAHYISPPLNISIQDIHDALQKFWESEELRPHPDVIPLHDQCEEIFRTTTTRDSTGRYMVTLPFLPNTPELGDTHAIALRRFLNLEKKLQANPSFGKKYVEFMTQYIDLGHMTPCHPNTFVDKAHYYIPHHGILKPGTEKLRTVFDGSCKSSNGVSLNDCLHTGAPLQQEIMDIIMNFRTHAVVFSTDIRMMFRNVLVHPDHRRFQLILWRSSPDQPLLTYALNTVTYGLRSSPYHAIRTLIQLAEDEGHRYPRAAQVIIKSTFVDDILSGSDSISDAKALQTELIQLLAFGGFHLSKWTSNCHDLLEQFPDDQCDMRKDFDIGPDSDSIKVLGILWIPRTDEFTYRIISPKTDTVTKRSMLSSIVSLYDPNGWITPVIFRAKLLLQQLWMNDLDWDEPTPPDIQRKWQQIVQDLPHLSNIRLSRHVCSHKSTSTYSLHGFSDASEAGYAAVVYLRELNADGQVNVHLILAKSKVSPLKKKLTTPKLELTAAHLLSQLMTRVSTQLSAHIHIQQHVCWTDSTIVLAWLNTPPHRLQVFEANRVSNIKANTCNLVWRHVPSALNPADCASRGISAQDILSLELWWSPSWLREHQNTWPAMPPALGHHLLPGLKPKKVLSHIAIPDVDTEMLTRFSSLDKLVGVTACIRRFTSNCRKARDARLTGPLTVCERHDALMYWVCSVQQNTFAEDIHRLQTNGNCTVRMKRLSPFLQDNLLRVGGRLAHAPLRFSAQHPLILPSSSPLVDLIIDHYHRVYCHPGADTLHALPISALRRFRLVQALSQRFWTRWVQSYLHTLQTRSKWSSPSAPPQIGELVLIQEDHLPPLHWRLGRIARTLPRRDGIVRVVELDTAYGRMQRPVLKLARLPVDESLSAQCQLVSAQASARPRQDVRASTATF
ncbi:hypothetical protein ACJJTC_016427, partial [Scirpophaga incertulas]